MIEGKRYTLAECNDLLQHDLAIAAAIVQRCLPMPKPDHVQAALALGKAMNLSPAQIQQLIAANGQGP